jgi:hypothetical protein
MTDGTGDRPMVINGFLTGAGTLYVITGSVVITAIVTSLAVVLILGQGRSR